MSRFITTPPPYLGGGVFLYGATATFTNSNIYNNTAVAGAGVYGMFFNAIAPVLNLLSYADVYSNNALTGTGLGGGIYMDQGTVSVADCSDIYSNDAILGGGVYLATSTLTMAGDCSEIDSNTATGNGGGIYALTSTVNLDDQAELYYNQAGYGSGTGNGGGAYLDDSILMGDKAQITYNSAATHGWWGVCHQYLPAGYGPGWLCLHRTTLQPVELQHGHKSVWRWGLCHRHQ